METTSLSAVNPKAAEVIGPIIIGNKGSEPMPDYIARCAP
jgi:hypothetical protein